MSSITLHNSEEWRAIPQRPGYEASDLGRIRSVNRTVVDVRGRNMTFEGRLLKLSLLGKGYRFFVVWNPAKKSTLPMLVSRAVLFAFKGPPPSDAYQACHCNGDKDDNRLINLRWDTQIGNELDKLEHGTLRFGDLHHMAKLTNAQVAKIKQDDRLHRVIAIDYGISRSHVSSIKCGSFRKRG